MSAYLDDEPSDVHPLTCAVWNSNDDCDCGSFEAGVQAKLDQFESYAGSPSERVTALTQQVARLRQLQTLGGEPPPFNAPVWRNRTLPGGPDPEYRGI